MSPTCSNAALRVLVSVLLASSVADAAALRHQVLDTRDAAQLQNAQIAADAIQAAASVIAENPKNFFQNVSEDLSHRSAWSILQDFFERLFGPREDSSDSSDSSDDEPTTVTVTVTPTPAPVGTSFTPIAEPLGSTGVVSSDVSSVTSAPGGDLMSILPVGSMSTAINASFITPVFVTDPIESPAETPSTPIAEPLGPTEVVSSDVSSVTSAPGGDLMSILPVGSMSTAINASFITPVFVTDPVESPAETPSVIEIIAPFPLFNDSASTGPLPTAVIITGEFSVTIPVATDVSVPAPANSSAPLGTGLAPAFNFTATYPALAPSLVTGVFEPTALSNSTGTTLNVTVNSTSVVLVTATLTPVPIALVTGTAAASVGTGLPVINIGTPLWTNSSYNEATLVAPIMATGTGLPVIGTGSPIIGTGLPAIGTGVPSAGSFIPLASEVPTFPNTTAPTIVLPVPILVTGVPDVAPANITVPTNTTVEAPAPELTFLPVTVSGVPGSVVNISVLLPLPIFANSTTLALASEATVAPSVGTGLSLPISAIGTPTYANTTTATSVIFETATALLILPPPVATDAVPVEAPGNATSPIASAEPGYGS